MVGCFFRSAALARGSKDGPERELCKAEQKSLVLEDGREGGKNASSCSKVWCARATVVVLFVAAGEFYACVDARGRRGGEAWGRIF